MTGFTGEVHPYTAEYPLLPEDELAGLAADIAENGLSRPLTIDQHGRLIDGQNRLAACARAGVEPQFTVVEFADDAAVAAYVSTQNDQRRFESSGVKWLRIGEALVRQGKRRNGRWERGAITESGNSGDVNQRMTEVGLVLDVAARAATLGDGFDTWAKLPARIKHDGLTLSAAHKIAQDFETHAAMALLVAYEPLLSTLGALEEAASDVERHLPIPVIEPDLEREHRDRIEQIAKRLREASTTIRNYLKGNQ